MPSTSWNRPGTVSKSTPRRATTSADPYGYTAVKEPHPAPARRSRGLTKTRLAVDPVRGPVVTQIFYWRVIDHLTYWQIAKRLNADPDRYPPPTPTRTGTAVGQWTLSSVRTMLQNPKYTGHMVWNRTTSRTGVTLRRKKTHRPNPADQWIWSDQPTHPALVTLDTYRAAQTMSSDNTGSRPGYQPNTHPATQQTYLLRGLIRCGHCGHRLHGTRQDGRTYYKCSGPRNSAGKPTRPDHPASLYVREDALAPAVTDLIAARVFGPDRQAHLHRQFTAAPRKKAAEHARKIEVAQRTVDTILTRQHNLMVELQDTGPDDTSYRASIRHQFRDLDQQLAQARATLAGLHATRPAVDDGTPELLDTMPQAAVNLSALPDAIQRRLFDALHLNIRLDNPRRAHVTITLTADTPTATAGAVAGTQPDAGDNPAEAPQLPAGGLVPDDVAAPVTNTGDAMRSPIGTQTLRNHGRAPTEVAAFTSIALRSEAPIRTGGWMRHGGRHRFRARLAGEPDRRRRRAD